MENIVEDLEQHQSPIRYQPVFRLGRITNKYLIISIYSLAYPSREEGMLRLFRHDRSSRTLLIQLYSKLPQLIPHSLEYFVIDF